MEKTLRARGGPVWQLYQKLYANRGTTPRERYFAALSRCAPHAQRVLDLGCGYTAPILRQVTTPAEKFGIDMVDHFEPPPSQRLHLVRGDGSFLPFANGSFDVVFCRAVLEHVEHPQRVFSEVGRVLKLGGHFVFMTPNYYDIVSLASALIPNRWHGAIVNRLTGRDERDTYPTFYRANTRKDIRRLAVENGLEVVELIANREHPHYFQITLPTYLCGLLYEQTVQRCIPSLRPWLVADLRRTG